MNDLGWRADGIERARAAGGIELELYRRPGFEAGTAVRRADPGISGGGIDTDWAYDVDPGPEDFARRARRRRR